jgi:hypothetical protein
MACHAPLATFESNNFYQHACFSLLGVRTARLLMTVLLISRSTWNWHQDLS